MRKGTCSPPSARESNESFSLHSHEQACGSLVLSHGQGPPVVLLHGVTENAAIWAPLSTNLRHFRLLAVDLPGHGLSDPATSRGGQVREHARQLIDDILDALSLYYCPGDRPLTWRHVRPLARSRRFRPTSRSSRSECPPSRCRAYACACRCHCSLFRGLRHRCLALTQPASRLSPPARPGAGLRRSSGRAGPADPGAAPVRTPAAERQNRGVAHARDRHVPPAAPRSVLTSAELAAIDLTAPDLHLPLTIFTYSF